MPIQAHAADNTIHEFPNGTPDAVIDRAMQEYAAQSKSSMGWGDVAKGAVTNMPSSALNLGKNIYTAVRHPLDTAGTALDVAAGELQKVTPEPIRNAINSMNPEASKAANDKASALNDFYANRYGSMEGFKHAIAEDPAGVMADTSILAGGTGALAKAGGLTKAAALADKLGTVSNPISLAAKGIKGTANLGGRAMAEALGVTTGAGSQSIRTAFGAGEAGGPAATALADNMRGNIPIEKIVADAKTGITNLEKRRGAEYRAGMGPVNSDPTVLNLAPVDQAIAQSNSINNFKGIDLSPSTAATRQKITDVLDLWKKQNPADFHTPGGFDALKKALKDVKDGIQFDQPANRLIADKAYNAVRDEIANQSPGYAATMKGYAEASDKIDELRSTFSLGEGKQRDTAIRKLQSSLRDNVNTSFGRRTALAKELANAGAPNLMESIAGQTLTSLSPRGLGKLLASGEAGGAVVTALMGNPSAAAAILPVLAAQSPRLVGEGALALGRGARLGKMLIRKPKNAAEAALIADELGAANNNSSNPSLGRLLMENR